MQLSFEWKLTYLYLPWFQIQVGDNAALYPMMEALEKIASADLGTKVDMNEAPLESLLPKVSQKEWWRIEKHTDFFFSPARETHKFFISWNVRI